MRKRLLIGSGILAGCVLLVLVVLWCLPPRPGVVSKANFDRVEKGMTFKDVSKLLGKHEFFNDFDEKDFDYGACHGLMWMADDGASASVWFEDRRVIKTRWRESPEGIFDKIHRWLGLKA